MRTINFGKYLRLFQIEPIKTVEIRFVQIGKIGAKILHTVQCVFNFLRTKRDQVMTNLSPQVKKLHTVERPK